MRPFLTALVFLASLTVMPLSHSLGCLGLVNSPCPRDCGKEQSCCSGMGGISYCDSSAGFYVCNNGHYSTCYCDRHAVMDFQALEGCCMWQGGIYKTTRSGKVICRNGQEAEICSIQNSFKPRSNF
jgi:hypothetical protein